MGSGHADERISAFGVPVSDVVVVLLAQRQQLHVRSEARCHRLTAKPHCNMSPIGLMIKKSRLGLLYKVVVSDVVVVLSVQRPRRSSLPQTTMSYEPYSPYQWLRVIASVCV